MKDSEIPDAVEPERMKPGPPRWNETHPLPPGSTWHRGKEVVLPRTPLDDDQPEPGAADLHAAWREDSYDEALALAMAQTGRG